MNPLRPALSVLFAAFLAGTAFATRTVLPADILGATPASLARNEFDDCMLTGVVSLAFSWQGCSCIVVSADDPNGPGVYVGSRMPGCVPAVLEGASRLYEGDVVNVTGHGLAMLLEPGFVAERVSVVGHVELPAPEPSELADLVRGRVNNRRVRLTGVVWSATVQETEMGPMTIVRMGTSDGMVRVRLSGARPEIGEWRNRDVVVDGLAMAMFNARSEFICTEIEALDLRELRLREPVSDGSGAVPLMCDRGKGLFASPEGRDGHLVGVRGEVTHVDRRGGTCIVRVPPADPVFPVLSVRVDLLRDSAAPAVGDFVKATGFPVMSGDCGILLDGVVVPVPREGTPPSTPEALSERELSEVLTHGNQPGSDYLYRLVRIEGRVDSVERMPSGETRFAVSTERGRFSAFLEDGDAVDFDAFVDRPLAVLTGVLSAHLVRNAENGRVMAVGEIELRLRSVADVTPLGDSESRLRHLGRLALRALYLSTVPLALTVVCFLLAGWRRKVRAAAVAEDRRRMAEELHDSVSQHLAGARMMIYTVKATEERMSDDGRETLGLAAGVLESARREVRDAVMRLKSDEVTVKPAEALIRETAEAISTRSKIKSRTKLCSFPSWVAGEVKTDILSIVHEAVTNAVKHGKAKTVLVIADRIGSNGLSISVLNDGAPFDAAAALGPETGHFGLSGMRERAERSGFRLSFGSRKEWVEVKLERGEG